MLTSFPLWNKSYIVIEIGRNKDVKNNNKVKDYVIGITFWFGSQTYLLPSTAVLGSLQRLMPQLIWDAHKSQPLKLQTVTPNCNLSNFFL